MVQNDCQMCVCVSVCVRVRVRVLYVCVCVSVCVCVLCVWPLAAIPVMFGLCHTWLTQVSEVPGPLLEFVSAGRVPE